MVTSTVSMLGIPTSGVSPLGGLCHGGGAHPHMGTESVGTGAAQGGVRSRDGTGPRDPPATRRPSVAPSRLRAHTPRGGGGAAGREVESESLRDLCGAASRTAGGAWVRFPWGGDEEESRSHDAEPGRPAVRVTPPMTGAPSWCGPAGIIRLASGCAPRRDLISSSSSYVVSMYVYVCLCECCVLVRHGVR